jgi:hypothetical protein
MMMLFITIAPSIIAKLVIFSYFKMINKEALKMWHW